MFIDAGNGSGVIDRLRQLHHDVIEVHFAGQPSEPQYLNKRAEMWWNLKDWIMQGAAIPDLVDLKQDLAAPTYKFTASDKMQLESKDDMKSRGLPSPDLGDALALTFAHQVYRDHSVESRARALGLPVREEGGLDSYDPYRKLN